MAFSAVGLSIAPAADSDRPGDMQRADRASVTSAYRNSDGSIRISLDDIASGKAIPDPQPVAFLEVSRDRARRINGATPYSTAPNPAARAFRLAGSEQSRARAVDCLAAAQYYEAGMDFEGQRAVAQVILNRVRHPAYPASVCGVVFQGAELSTGCQFTFTCDGALARAPIPWAWDRSLAIAREALSGSVFAKVGLATHYHTDWVVPDWSGELEKITNVSTHLFFRWPGAWGRPGVFRNTPSVDEPIVTKLARISKNHRQSLTGEDEVALAISDSGPQAIVPLASGNGAMALPSLAGINLRGSQLRLAHPAGDAFGFLLQANLPGSYGLLAYDVCKGRSFCKVMGWTDVGAIPPGFPITFEAQSRMAFMYVYDRANRREIMAWNCDLFPRDNPAECLSSDKTRWDSVRQS